MGGGEVQHQRLDDFGQESDLQPGAGRGMRGACGAGQRGGGGGSGQGPGTAPRGGVGPRGAQVQEVVERRGEGGYGDWDATVCESAPC